MEFKSLVIVLSCCAATITMANAFSPPIPHCTELKPILVGANIYKRLMSSIYNTKIGLEDIDGPYGISEGLFEGIKVMGAFGVYSRALRAVSNKNSTYFNGLDFTGLMGAMMTQMMTNTCIWLNSHGDSLTLRNNTIDCTNEEEMLLLASFIHIYPQVDKLRVFWLTLGCPNVLPADDTPWLNSYMNSSYHNEINFLLSDTAK